MFKDVQCEHHWSHGTHTKPIVKFLPNVPSFALLMVSTAAVICAFSSSTSLGIECTAHRPILSQIPAKKRPHGVRSGWPKHEIVMILPIPSNPSVWQCCVQKLSNPKAPVWWRPILLENEVTRLILTQVIH